MSVQVPFLDLGATYRELKDEIDAAVARVLASGWYLLGGELVELQAAITANQKTQNKLKELLGNLSQVPLEDPLLGAARNAVEREKMALKRLQIEYADDNPLIIRAKERLRLAEDNLRLQMQGVRHGLTTDQSELVVCQR